MDLPIIAGSEKTLHAITPDDGGNARLADPAHRRETHGGAVEQGNGSAIAAGQDQRAIGAGGHRLDRIGVRRGNGDVALGQPQPQHPVAPGAGKAAIVQSAGGIGYALMCLGEATL